MTSDQIRIVFSTSITNGILNAIWGASTIIVPLIAFGVGASYIEITLISSIFSIAHVIFPPFWGVLSDRTHHGKLLITVTFLASIPFFTIMIIPNLTLLLWMRFLWGVLTASVPVVTLALLRKSSQDHVIGRNMGWYSTIRSLGWALGLLVVGFTITLFSINNTIIMFSLLPIIGVVIFSVLTPKDKSSVGKDFTIRGVVRETYQIIIRRFRLLASGGSITRFCLYTTITMSAYGILFSLLTVYFVELSIPTEIFSSILFINTGIGIVVSPIFGLAADMYDLRSIILFGALSFVIGTLLLSTGSLDLFLLVAVMVLTGFGNVMINTAGPIYITTQSQRIDTGEILGVFWSALSLGWIIGPLIGGGIATYFGSLISAFVFALILFSIALAIVFWSVESNKQK